MGHRQQVGMGGESAMRNSSMPLWRLPSTSPGPRRRRSSSAMTKPSSVSRMVFSRASRSPPAAANTAGCSWMPRAAPDAAAQLVQLGQAEALGMLHHHDGGFRHVHADFDHGGGDQQLGLAGLEGGHGGVALGRFHLAMHQADIQARAPGAASRRGPRRRPGRSSRIPPPAGTPNRRGRPGPAPCADARSVRPAGRRSSPASRPACGPAGGR